MNSKKGIAAFRIVLIIMAAILLIVLLYETKSFIKNYTIKQEYLICNQFINSVQNSQAYFENNEIPTQKFIQSITKLCKFDAKEINSRKEAISLIAHSAYNCWRKFGSGKVDFLGANTATPIVILCSEFKINNELENINTDIIKELKKKRYEELFRDDNSNLNNKFLSENLIPKNFHKNEKIYIYFIYYKKVFKTNRLTTKYLLGLLASSNINFVSGTASFINKYLNDYPQIAYIQITDKFPEKVDQRKTIFIVPELIKVNN